MKSLWTSLRKNKSVFLFLTILFLFGVATGILFYYKQDSGVRDTILNSMTNLFQNNVFAFKNAFYHLFLLLIVCACMFCFLGIPIFICYLFFEGLSIGFILPIFLGVYKIRGLVYFLVYFLFTKFIYLFLISFFFIKMLHFIKNYWSSIKQKNYEFMRDVKYFGVFLFLIVLNDLGVYFISNQILIFLLK